MQNNENVNPAQLEEHLKSLFLLCGLPQEEMEQPMSLKNNLRGGLFRSANLDYFVNMLDRRAVLAVENLKAEKMENWSAARSEEYIEQLEQQLIEQRDQCYQLEQQIERLSLREQKAQEQQLDAAFQEQQTPPAQEAEKAEDQELWWIREMIAFRDRLQQKQDWVENLPQEQQASADKLIKLQMQESRAMLEQRGVGILDAGGSFCKEYQTVMMTQPAPEENLIDQIAQTVRPGYRWQEEVLRAQEVVLYVKEDANVPEK